MLTGRALAARALATRAGTDGLGIAGPEAPNRPLQDAAGSAGRIGVSVQPGNAWTPPTPIRRFQWGETAFVPGTSKSSGNNGILGALPLEYARQGPDCYREK